VTLRASLCSMTPRTLCRANVRLWVFRGFEGECASVWLIAIVRKDVLLREATACALG